jgi:hypothetical protein
LVVLVTTALVGAVSGEGKDPEQPHNVSVAVTAMERPENAARKGTTRR